MDQILGELVHLLFEGLLVGLALELVSFLENGAELNVFYVDEGYLEVTTD